MPMIQKCYLGLHFPYLHTHNRNYHGIPNITVTPLEAIIQKVAGTGIQVKYELGSQILGEGTWMFQNALAATQGGELSTSST